MILKLRGPHKDHSTKVWSQLAKLVSEEKILNDFFLSNFLLSAMAAMLVGSGIIGYYSERGPPKSTINLAKLSPNWPSGFRGEY